MHNDVVSSTAKNEKRVARRATHFSFPVYELINFVFFVLLALCCLWPDSLSLQTPTEFHSLKDNKSK